MAGGPVAGRPSTLGGDLKRGHNEADSYGEALARVREQTPNFHVTIPFVRTLWELEACVDMLDASPLGRRPNVACSSSGRWGEANARRSEAKASIGSLKRAFFRR
jgi:hypothetical protein